MFTTNRPTIQNPTPTLAHITEPGIYVFCHTCGNTDKILTHIKPIIIFRDQCALCAHEVQSVLSTDAVMDIQSRITSIREWIYNGNKHGESFLGHYVNIPHTLNKHVNLLEDVIIFAHHMILSRNLGDRYIAIVNFCKLRGSRIGFSSTLMYLVSDLFGSTMMEKKSYGKEFVQEIHDRVDYSPQSLDMNDDNIFSTARSYLGCYDKLKETAIYKKLYKLLLYMLSVGMLEGVNVTFDSLNFSKFEAAAVSKTHAPGIDMFHCMIDTVLFVCERGLLYMRSGDAGVIFHSGSTYEKWVFTANKLTRDARFLANPEPHGINKFTYISELKEAIEKGKAILKFTAGLDKFEKTYIARILSDMQLIESEELTRKASQMPRKDPFAILIHGSSSICKSQLKQILFYHYGKYFDMPIGAEYMYTRCPTDEYWSGFNSTQWCIVMDDIAFLKPNGEVDPTLKEMLQVKNSVPYSPPQAALEDKGRTPVRAELLIGTTNTKHLNLHAYFACPFAIARRLSYVLTARVKSQYTKMAFMADSELIPITPDGEYMNIWNFEISIPTPSSDQELDAQQTAYVVIKKFEDINDMLAWYIATAKEHVASQTKAMNADATMNVVEICKICYRTKSACICSVEELFTPQAEETFPTETFEDYPWNFRVALWFYSQIILCQVNEFHEYILQLKEIMLQNSHITYILLCTMAVLGPCHLLVLGFLTILAASVYRYFWVILYYHFNTFGGDAWKFHMLFRICGNRFSTYRLLFRLAGDRVRKSHFTTPSLIALSVFLSSTTIILALRKYWTSVMAPQSMEGSMPIPMEVEKPTFYYQDPYVNTGVEISGASRCVQNDQLDLDVIRSTAKIIFHFDIRPGQSCATTALNIKGTIWMLNKHSVQSGDGSLDIIFDDVSQNVSRNIYGIKFTQKDVATIANSDLAFMDIRALPPGRDLVKYFPLAPISGGRYTGKYHTITREGMREVNPIFDIRNGKCPVFGIAGYHAKSQTLTRSGDCGSVAVVQIGNSQVLMGTHTCGNSVRGIFFQTITQTSLLEILGKFKPQVDEGTIPISAPGYDRTLVTLHPKSTLRFLQGGTATIMGSFSGYRPLHKSKVEKTYIRDYVVRDGEYKDVCGPPNMSWKPWNLAITDMTRPVYTFDNSILDECESSFLENILSKLGSKIDQIEVYTQDVALNGVAGVTYVDRLNISTSAGNPFKKSKKHFITLNEENRIENVDPIIQERINLIEESYVKGIRFNPQFCAHLKDEPTPMKKVLLGKTRVFTGGEFAWSVVVRKFLLSHIRVIQNNPFVFEAMPGIVAQSTEWTKLYKYVTKFGAERIICGDYGKFDKKMVAAFILAAFNILIGMSRAAGWSETELLVLRCIAYDTAFAHIDFNGDYISVQGNPSGHPLTVIINCLVNSLYMRYAFRMISKKPLSEFQNMVSLATYGDDNIMGVSPECPEFNHTAVAAELGKIGVVYTMAEKEAESVPYIHIDEASFLKRKFVFDHDVGTFVAPLEHASIDKMLTSYIRSGVLAPPAHAVCVIETALREYFFYGKGKFEERRQYFLQLIQDCDLGDWVRDSTIPTYSQLVQDFWMRFGDVESAEKHAC